MKEKKLKWVKELLNQEKNQKGQIIMEIIQIFSIF